MEHAVRFEIVDPASGDAVWAMGEYFDELDRRFEGGFAVGGALDEAAAEYKVPTGAFVLATREGEVVGCGGVVHLDEARSEIKRMWVAPAARGQGLAKLLLARLEDEARRAGRTTVVLDTNRSLPEAVALYESAGYDRTERYSDNRYAHHWFRKRLSGG